MWSALLRIIGRPAGGGKRNTRDVEGAGANSYSFAEINEYAAQHSSASVLVLPSNISAAEALRRVTQLGPDLGHQDFQHKRTDPGGLEGGSSIEGGPAVSEEPGSSTARERGSRGQVAMSLDLEAMATTSQPHEAGQPILFPSSIPARRSTNGGGDAIISEDMLQHQHHHQPLPLPRRASPNHRNAPPDQAANLQPAPLPPYQQPAVAVYVAPDAACLQHVHADATAEVRQVNGPKPLNSMAVRGRGASGGGSAKLAMEAPPLQPQPPQPPQLHMLKPTGFDPPVPAAAAAPAKEGYAAMRGPGPEPAWPRPRVQAQQQQPQPELHPHAGVCGGPPMAVGIHAEMEDLDEVLRNQPQRPVIVRYEDLKLQEQVGEGGFGKVRGAAIALQGKKRRQSATVLPCWPVSTLPLHQSCVHVSFWPVPK